MPTLVFDASRPLNDAEARRLFEGAERLHTTPARLLAGMAAFYGATEGLGLVDGFLPRDRFIEDADASQLVCDDGVGDICGLCGEPGADKMALWTGGGAYWPGETIPEGEMVHGDCEREETARAHAALSVSQRNAVLRDLRR